jgi:hypothetical protein
LILLSRNIIFSLTKYGEGLQSLYCHNYNMPRLQKKKQRDYSRTIVMGRRAGGKSFGQTERKRDAEMLHSLARCASLLSAKIANQLHWNPLRVRPRILIKSEMTHDFDLNLESLAIFYLNNKVAKPHNFAVKTFDLAYFFQEKSNILCFKIILTIVCLISPPIFKFIHKIIKYKPLCKKAN